MHWTWSPCQHRLPRVLIFCSPLEFAPVILLVAIVAAIALTLGRRPQAKYQDPAQQVLVRRADRVRIIKMSSEKKRGSA